MYREKVRKPTALLAAFLLAASVMTGCGSGQQPVPSEAAEVTAETTTTAAAETTAEAGTETAAEAESTVSEGQVRQITDMSGRLLEIPEEIDKVFSTGPVAAIYLYTMDPERMLGWNYELNALEKKIILPEYHGLPSFGMGDSVNYEAVIAAGPQIALDVSSGNDAAKAEADKLSDSLGIPVVIISNKLEDTAEAYRFLGELFGDSARGEELAAYVTRTFEDVADAGIPEEDKVSIYYGNGETSLETAPKGSTHAQIIDFVNARNVAEMETESGSRVQISLEQLLAWDPDYIIVNGEPKQDLSGGAAAQAILEDPDFAHLKAVQSGNVFGAPNTPFSWVDRPPGPNRIIGIRWLSKRIYPDVFEYEINDEVKVFYQLFYHLELTDEQLDELLND